MNLKQSCNHVLMLLAMSSLSALPCRCWPEIPPRQLIASSPAQPTHAFGAVPWGEPKALAHPLPIATHLEHHSAKSFCERPVSKRSPVGVQKRLAMTPVGEQAGPQSSKGPSQDFPDCFESFATLQQLVFPDQSHDVSCLCCATLGDQRVPDKNQRPFLLRHSSSIAMKTKLHTLCSHAQVLRNVEVAAGECISQQSSPACCELGFWTSDALVEVNLSILL